MHLQGNSFILLFIAGALMLCRAVRADDLNTVLQRLDAAARNFHTTTANFEFDTIQTDPIPDTDVMTGAAYYERKGSSFQMAAHIHAAQRQSR